MQNKLLFIFCLCIASYGFTQTAQPQDAAAAPTTQQSESASQAGQQASDTDIQLMREDVRSERKKLVAANLPLTEAEAVKFWPVYDRYIGEKTKVNDSRGELIKEYAQNYQSMTDAKASSLTKRWVALESDDSKIRLKYVPEFEKVISPRKTAMFYQIDRRISLIIELQLASQVPLVRP